jgi:predicted acylesterase/phospholipase RssA
MDTLVISGGDFKIFAAIGALGVLEDHGILKNIRNLAGSSAGALVIVMLAMHYSPVDMRRMLSEQFHVLRGHIENIKIDNIIQLFDRFGINNHDPLEYLVDAVFTEKDIDPDITFMDFVKKTGMNVVITGSNITTETVEFFHVDSHPDMRVKDALKISMCVPFMFEPVNYNGCMYIDGGFYQNLPINYFPKERMIAINLRVEETVPKACIQNLDTYMLHLIFSLMNKSQVVDVQDSRFICEILFQEESFVNFSEMTFNFDETKLESYVQKGEDGMRDKLKINTELKLAEELKLVEDG